MSQSISDLGTLKYIITHVFCPLRLPDGDDHNILSDQSLAGAVASAVRLHNDRISDLLQWHSISRMLNNLRAVLQLEDLDKSQVISQLRSMVMGDVRAFLVRAQNAAVIFRKQKDTTIIESFEVSPTAGDVMGAEGRLICSYPGPAIEVPNVVFDEKGFLSELANFLTHMNNDVLDTAPTSRKARSTVVETRDTTHPRYITELLTGILRGVGHPADIIRITKRVGDDVSWNNSKLPWRRSPLWLLIRVSIQTSLDRSTLGRIAYKQFMLFFMCSLANEKMAMGLPNDTLQFMSAKISKRLRKLGSSAPDWLLDIALQTCTSLRSVLEKRWGEVQAAQCVSPLWTPSKLDLHGDVELSLLNSRNYLRDCLTNKITSHSNTSFTLVHRARGALNDFLSADGAFFEEAYRSEPHITLYDVEHAVEQDIDVWVDNVEDHDEACVKLEILGHKYSSNALTTYEDNPELLSVMLLTMIELWIALDKIALREIPMLAEYSPEVPTSLLEHFLLSKLGNLRRLNCAYQYLSSRHSRSHSGWSVFSSPITSSSFPARFYRGSSHLQHIKAQIEGVACREVSEKVAELERANTRHAELKKKADQADHEYMVNRRGTEYHANHCNKCRLKREANGMRISVHEWPLPADQVHAEVVVFELDCPVSFNMWRSATLHLLVDLCSPSIKSKHPYMQLVDYAALQPYLVHHQRSRVTLGSDTKPFTVTHYRNISIPTTRQQVCVNNGLTFYGFDTCARIAVSELLGPFNIKKYCTYELGRGPYQNMQKYVDATLHTSNEIMANQADCHKDLSIHEFIAFGLLRSGGRLQWLNVLRELRGRSLTFRRQEVHLLLAQAVSQVGPLHDTPSKWHDELQRSSFCCALLDELESLISDIEANWLEAVTMDTISFLLRRVLASSPDQGVSRRALDLLRVVRGKLFSWVEELSAKLTITPGDLEFSGFLRDTAAICRSTFDVDPSLIHESLHSVADIKVLLSSAVLLHDHTPSNVSSLPAYSQLLLARDRRLSLALESVLSGVIQADSSDQGIDLAIHWVWPDYRPGSKWTPLQNPNSRWLSCETASTAEQSSQRVHFNLLDGSLLVDGKSLGRLPNEILQHRLYNLIFGQHVLDVIPGDLPGMDYSTRGSVSGHQVYFSLRNNGLDLVIRAKRKPNSDNHDDDSAIIELIPQEKLASDLPAVLVEGHAHWLNLSTSTMEIRPLDSLWEASSANWTIDCTPGAYRMKKGDRFLIDVRSRSWKMISTLMKPFDIPQNLLIYVSQVPTSSFQLSVVLPRYGLSFYIDEDGDLQSRNMRGMVYDTNQSFGALFGLVNRLVLRPKTRHADAIELVPRCVLIPEGDISFHLDGHHVNVEVDTRGTAIQRMTYQTYTINTELGCLTGNVILTNSLYCAYLHAVTSGCGSDPLTGRSGTEEAISLLRSAGCWSIMKFGSREAELLGLIASLCPQREWYPEHLKCMQKISWLELPVNSQHHELYVIARGIKEHCERLQIFHESHTTPLFRLGRFPVRDDHLLQRSARRAAHLFPSEFSGQPSGTDFDVQHSARDVVNITSKEQRACAAAAAVYHQTAYAATTKDLLNMVESWSETVSGSTALSLQYDSSWLTPDLPSIWLKGYNLLRRNDKAKWFEMLFSLPAMAYASSRHTDLVPVFIAFASDPRFRTEDPPRYYSYDIADGYRPSQVTLGGYISSCAQTFECSPEGDAPARRDESEKDLQVRRYRMYNDRLESDTDATVSRLLSTWPCEIPPFCSLSPALYNVSKLTSDIEAHFSSRFHNLKLKEHLIRVQNLLNSICPSASPISTPQYSFQSSHNTILQTCWSVALDDLFARPLAAPSLQMPSQLVLYSSDDIVMDTWPSPAAALHELLATVQANAVNSFQDRYVSALRASAECFESEISVTARAETELPTTENLVTHYTRCKANYIKSLDCIKRYLAPRSQCDEAVERSGQWPRITAYTLFRSLASNSPTILPDGWKKCLIRLVLLALELQRVRRLLRLHLDNLHEDLRREVQNEGCDGWDPNAHPDWLLIQLQGNFLVRHVQAGVAAEMISPRSGNNTAMQLNMGEGKSSVIVPIVVTVLADGTQLVRVIVPKALTAQMFHLLVDRLGGLTNRRIYFLPFSRSLDLSDSKVEMLRGIVKECKKERGILVVQPEHVLSLKLLSVEKQLCQEESALSRRLLNLQKWLHSRTRDILDESDEILHVRYQLVYTIGLQQHMEGFPDRWTTTEQVLALVNKHASSLRELFPLGVEYEQGPSGSFPHLRVPHADAGEMLISWIVQDVMEGLLPNFNFGQLRSSFRNAIQNFLSCQHVPPTQVRLVKDYAQQTSLWNGLLLLRGLLASGILLYVFRERRWRVDYGLAPARTMLAVPYRAKDVPAQRAEFGHPDIAIILTCLSYYYGGLNEEQLKLSFEMLLKQDDPAMEYGLWVRDCPAVPEYLRTTSGVNLKSFEQWNKFLLPLFKRNRATVDFYLSNVVFPKEAKEFPSKLSCSGWDLAERKERVLTGFSGTNDGQYLLPLHITQRDPDHQRGTNAKVLSYLLQPENQSYMCMTDENGERRTTHSFLETLASQKPEIRVLLDVGAQMLDLQNHELAKTWLAINKNASAAIYFNEDDELTVLTRDGNTNLLISSPFAQQLDQCVVYLDDAHTRGTDIKFPSGFRAAVTLGPKVTKDRLAQGCMRMRKLGHNHSIMFFAPLEIDRRIRSVASKGPFDAVNTMDILQWTIRETCDDIQHRAAHWAQQGVDHTSRYAVWTDFCSGEVSPKEVSEKWLQPEAKRLEDLYGPNEGSNSTMLADPDIRQRCVELGVLSLRDVSMDEEQEREVVHEAERERQVERPAKVSPATHSTHQDVVTFIRTGVVPTRSKAFCRAFDTLDSTSAAAREPHIWSQCLLTTTDFQKTVISSCKADDYLRPVMWVVSGGKRSNREALVIFSPEEANHLLPDIRRSHRVHLHLYTPRVTESMKPCDGLDLYSIPSVSDRWTPPAHLMDQLNAFSGQLYLKDYQTYIRLCRFLCVYARDLQDEEGIEVGCDGFIPPNHRPAHLRSVYTFQTTPLDPLRKLMGLRRKGMRFAPTHMGKLVDGRLLSERDFDDSVMMYW